MSEKHWRTILIDPLVEKLDVAFIIKKGDYMTRMKSLLQFHTLHFFYTPGRDMVFLVDDEGLLKDDANERGFFQPTFSPTPICGRSLLIGLTQPEGDFTDCNMSLEQLKTQVLFPKVRFTGIVDREELTTHPVLGTMQTLIREAQFEQLPEHTTSKLQ